MAKKRPTAKGIVSEHAVPCLRIAVGEKPGATGRRDVSACAIVGENRGGVTKFDLKKHYGATSKTVTTPKTNKPCSAKRKGCPVQIAFDRGQPFLRFCVARNKPGYRVDVDSPAEAMAIASKACAVWKATGKFDFPEGTPLGRARTKRQRNR
jgi:hypothetical protein